ncbi:MAG: DMT family transporter [Pseudomonadota bacterium]
MATAGKTLPPQSRATIFALLAVLCWSTVATAFKLSLQHLSANQLLFLASLVATFALSLILWWQGQFNQLFVQSGKVYTRSFGFGLLNPLLYYVVLFAAYEQLPAQEAQALNYSWAIVLTLLAVPLLGHRLGPFDLLAAAVCYLGVLVIATRGSVLSLDFSNLQGVSLALLSTIIWSVYWILNKRDDRPPLLGLTLNFIFSLPVLALLLLFTGEWRIFISGLSLAGWLGGIYVGIVEIALGFAFWLQAMKYAVNTSRIANLIFLSPFLSLIFISTILGESIMMSTLVGLGLIVAGLLIQQGFGVKIEE